MSTSSTLYRLRLVPSVLNRAVPGPSAFVAPASQKRHYAAPAQGGRGGPPKKSYRQGFQGRKDDQGGGMSAPKKEKRSGAFRPMPVSQLTDPVFQTTDVDRSYLPAFRPELLTSSYAGKAMMFKAPENLAMRMFGVPKNMLLEFRILSQPYSVIRDVTVAVIDKLEAASQLSSHDTRLVLTGSPGCGKSFLLLQAVEYGVQTDWIVLYIPRAINLVNSTTTYTYDPRTRTYLQPKFAFQTLQRFRTVNLAKLESLQTQKEATLDRRAAVPAGTPLIELIDIGMKEQQLAPRVLSVLLEELGRQTTHPVLLAVDDFQALYCKSAYRDPQFANIRSYHLSMPRLLLEYVSGKRTFARGAVLGALSTADTTFRLPLELRKTLDMHDDIPISPYVKLSRQLLEYATGLQQLPVPEQLKVDEAASIFEVWTKDNAINQTAPRDELFMAKYSEAGGNARDFVWKGLLSTLTL